MRKMLDRKLREKDKGKMDEEKKAIWLNDEEMDRLAGFVAELLDRKELDDYQIEMLENVYDQLEQE